MTNANKLDKSLIFLKSMVISLAVILLVLIAAFFILKFNRSRNLSEPKCDNNLIIPINSVIDKFELQGNSIIILTMPSIDNGDQEIVKFDSSCGKVISRTTFKQPKIDEINNN